ncbi:hypothetical protein BDZ97DRAFT_1639729, partial [Flammula alnicola]
PHLLTCPDYSLDAYSLARAKLVSGTVTEEMAIQQLALAWSAGNNADKAAWIQAVELERAEADERDRIAKEAEDALVAAKIQEQDDILKEDKKQNKAKYLPLTKGGWVALWHLTNEGVKHAISDPASLDTDKLDIIRDASGGMSLIPAGATKSSRAVIDDANLTWDEFMQAATRMLHHMQLKRWQDDRVEMFREFWSNLQLHRFRYSEDPVEQRALLLYQ